MSIILPDTVSSESQQFHRVPIFEQRVNYKYINLNQYLVSKETEIFRKKIIQILYFFFLFPRPGIQQVCRRNSDVSPLRYRYNTLQHSTSPVSVTVRITSNLVIRTPANDHNIFVWEVMPNVQQQLNNMMAVMSPTPAS